MQPASRRRAQAPGGVARLGATASLRILAIALALVAGGCVSVQPAATDAPASPAATAATVFTDAPRTPRPRRTPAPTDPARRTPRPVPAATDGSVGVAAAGSPDESAIPTPTPTPRPTVPPPSLTPGPERPLALAPTEVFGYLPSWELANADRIDLDRITTLAWFGIEAGTRGTLVTESGAGTVPPGWRDFGSDEWTALKAKAQAKGIRVVATIERFSWTEGQAKRTTRLLQNPANRIRLVRELMALIREHDLDGISLDVEPVPAAASEGLTALVRELRAAMNAVDPGLQLTLAILPSAANVDVEAIVGPDAADALFVMGYEFLGWSSDRSGSHAPLVDPGGKPGADLATTIGPLLARVPADRVILGLPWYGRVWSTVSDRPHAPTRSGARYPGSSAVLYRDAILQAQRSGRRWSPGEGSAWTVYPWRADCTGCRLTWRQLWYEDVDSWRTKLAWARELGMRGAGIWALGYEGSGRELWSAIRYGLGDATDDRAPEGRARLDPASWDGERDGRPIVGDQVTLRLDARDEGSGLAFVRVAASDERSPDGSLRWGTTWPTVDAVTLHTLDASPVYDLPEPRPGREDDPDASPSPSFSPLPWASPGAGPDGSPTPSVTPTPSPTPSPSPSPSPTIEPSHEAGPRSLWIAWRDVAGVWSEPVRIDLWYRPDERPPTPAPVLIVAEPSVPPGATGEGITDSEASEPPAP